MEPDIVLRDEWGALAPTRTPKTPTKHKAITLHWAGRKPSIRDDNSDFVRAVQSWHMGNNKWSDIAYSFIVTRDGRIYEGRGLHWDAFAEGKRAIRHKKLHLQGKGWPYTYGLHNAPLNWNLYSYSILLQLGSEEVASTDMLDSCVRLCDYLLSLYPYLKIDTHNTKKVKACPGNEVTRLVDEGFFGPSYRTQKPRIKLSEAFPAPEPVNKDRRISALEIRMNQLESMVTDTTLLTRPIGPSWKHHPNGVHAPFDDWTWDVLDDWLLVTIDQLGYVRLPQAPWHYLISYDTGGQTAQYSVLPLYEHKEKGYLVSYGTEAPKFKPYISNERTIGHQTLKQYADRHPNYGIVSVAIGLSSEEHLRDQIEAGLLPEGSILNPIGDGYLVPDFASYTKID